MSSVIHESILVLFVICLLLGSIVGFLAGLLGIGGGLIIVPVLSLLLPWHGIDATLVMPMALATSLASIIITSSSSTYSHYRLGNVDAGVIRTLLPGILIGGFFGSAIVDMMPAHYLSNVFGGIVFFLALQMGFPKKNKGTRPFPSTFFNALSGLFVGVISSLAGIGGGSLTVPYLNYFGIPMPKAIGSAALCGIFLALSGMVGFIWWGLTQPLTLPPFSVGYVYLPALFGVVITSVWTTRYGAYWASRLPTQIIKRVFSFFLLLVGASMFFN